MARPDKPGGNRGNRSEDKKLGSLIGRPAYGKKAWRSVSAQRGFPGTTSPKALPRILLQTHHGFWVSHI
jgi:hypothetical protein